MHHFYCGLLTNSSMFVQRFLFYTEQLFFYFVLVADNTAIKVITRPHYLRDVVCNIPTSTAFGKTKCLFFNGKPITQNMLQRNILNRYYNVFDPVGYFLLP